MEKFNVLPTDNRFLSLYEEQKVALFEAMSNMPDLTMIKDHVQRTRAILELKSRPLESFLSEGILDRMRLDLRAAGKSEREVEETITHQLNAVRDLEIKKVEKGT